MTDEGTNNPAKATPLNELNNKIIEIFCEWREHVETLTKWNGKLPADEGAAQIQALITEQVRLGMESVEYWKAYDALYDVSTLGQVRRDGRILKQYTRGTGYKSVSLSIGNKKRSVSVHRLVAHTFLPNPQGKDCVNHIDGNKGNNVVTNLEWVTYSENMRHSVDVLGNTPWNKDKFLVPFCNRGHPQNEDTTHRKPSGNRYCNPCNTIRIREWRREQRKLKGTTLLEGGK